MANSSLTPLTPLSITVDHLNVTYSNARLALYNASCVVEPGTITGLVGPNGGGKSTLFKSIMGFLKPSQGQVRVGDCSVQVAQKRQWMAYVPQSDEVDWNFPISVSDVVMMGRYGYMNVLRIPSAGDRRIVDESLERVGLSDVRHRQIGELSGGQKKRTFLARALAQQGKVILLDEPFTGVDVKTEKRIIELLIQLRQDGHTILVSTHDLASISTFCDRVILLNQTVLAAGTTEETFTEENLSMTFGGLPLSRSSSFQFFQRASNQSASNQPTSNQSASNPPASDQNNPTHVAVQYSMQAQNRRAQSH